MWVCKWILPGLFCDDINIYRQRQRVCLGMGLGETNESELSYAQMVACCIRHFAPYLVCYLTMYFGDHSFVAHLWLPQSYNFFIAWKYHSLWYQSPIAGLSDSIHAPVTVNHKGKPCSSPRLWTNWGPGPWFLLFFISLKSAAKSVGLTGPLVWCDHWGSLVVVTELNWICNSYTW